MAAKSDSTFLPLPQSQNPNATNIAALIEVAKKMLAELDFEIEQRQHGGNDEDWCDLKRLSDEAHAAIAKATAGSA